MMKRTLVTLSGIAVALSLALTGCSSDPAKPTSAAAAPQMSDGEMAAKLKGEWTGEWSIGTFGGKFIMIVTDVDGTNVKGEGQWFGTAAGDTKSPLKTAVVKGGELSAVQVDGGAFTLKMADANKMRGTWTVTGYNGPLVVSRTK